MDYRQLLLRGAIDKRFLARTAGHRMMVMMISVIVTVEGAASSCLVLILLLILLMLTTSGASTAASTIPGSIRLSLSLRRRWLLLLLRIAIAAICVGIVRIGRAELMILLLVVDVRIATVVMKIRGPRLLCAVTGAVTRLYAQRLDVSVRFVRVARIFRSSTTSVMDSFVR